MSNEELSQNSQTSEGMLSREDRDTIGEMTNISMGAAVSTLSILLGKDVEMSTPQVTEYPNLMEMNEPFAADEKTLVCVQYVKGIQASAAFVMKNADAAKLAEMMLGGTGEGAAGALTELQQGAIGELMNQMMNSAATSMASVIHEAVEINNPEVAPYTIDALAAFMPGIMSEPFTSIEFKLSVGDDAVIEMVQFVISAEAKSQVTQILSIEPENIDTMAALSQGIEVGQPAAEMAYTAPQSAASAAGGGGSVPRPAPQPEQRASMNVDPVTVRPVEFASFDSQPNVYGEENKNLELVMDVTLNLTVELGKTEISIKDVLELTRGSVIELDRVAGEPVDLMANGKLIAKGEVVVIEDNFGLRITSIVSPADRLRGL